ncbi:cyclase [Oculatella sp. LEGE 06141]|nr:SRPBCC family protein [Oculatella sp. LEGE 06141]MBE9181500.1 cyclase [Oculatella sp. LEGE 06141]
MELPLENASAQGVDVRTEKLEGRKRRISANLQVPYSVEQLWQILTDYDHLADFIPSLAKSRRIDHPQGGVRLEQIGAQSFLKLKFCARVVLDMIETFPHQIDFRMVEGDFREFSGSWQIQSVRSSEQPITDLCYTVLVVPHLAMPVGLIERRLGQGLVLNLTAIRQRADVLFG